MMEAEFFGNAFYRKGCIGINALETCLPGMANTDFERFRIVEFRKKSIQEALRLHSTLTSGFSTICFISNMEIVGSTRTNKKNSMTKRPIVPAYVAQSQMVG